jgi:soluble lytic murein transglycosylase-like protein
MTELKNPLLALAAYNGGIDNARRWKSKSPGGDDDFFVADIGFAETKRYVIAVYGARLAYGSLQ